jgi:hypothetical protein
MFDTLHPPISPLLAVAVRLMPPAIEWGSPVQRAKGEGESFWHIPVNIHPGRRWAEWPRKFGPATVHACEVHLEKFDGDAPANFQLCWGDAFFVGEKATPVTTLRRGHPALIPIACRSEREDGSRAYWAEQRMFSRGERALSIKSDRLKRYFRLQIRSGSYCRTSSFYQLRVPLLGSNGHFTVEKVYGPIDEAGARREAQLRASTELYPDDREELERSVFVLSAVLAPNRLFAEGKRVWHVEFTVLNASKADVEIIGVSGRLARSETHIATLVAPVMVPRGKMKNFVVRQEVRCKRNAAARGGLGIVSQRPVG